MGTMLAALGESIVLGEALELSIPDMLEIMYGHPTFCSLRMQEQYCSCLAVLSICSNKFFFTFFF